MKFSKFSKKEQLQIYIAQGEAYRQLLLKTNHGGRYNAKIKQIEAKIRRAQQDLARIK
ncbi:hypothetical protein [Calderihabitans maritimus]|uniref:Uncharacterized protein n=1 Tax=Calderihabitans maritimus TaxID=1246530 RepID=A0A1Z5HNY3_9FIRM|nr:hypothetical protein [Calderihabitans maritimus]GAW91233.1 hypothetical protein KKC1_03950 [Calderihabitans maritimus]